MQALIDTVLEIDTPEHLAFRTRIGGPGRRMFAWMIDFAVRGMIFFGLVIFVESVFVSIDLAGTAQGVVAVIVFVLDWFYFFVCEMITGGRSPGKIAMKLRVV